MREEQKTVFISYRRDVASFIARAIFLDLRNYGYDVFIDVESIDSGKFEQIIFNQIEARAHFVVILTPGTVERYDNLNDMMRREIEYAMETKRNIVPLLVNDFKFNDDTRKHMTGKLADLPNFNGMNLPHDYFDSAMEKLRSRFLKQPVDGTIKPPPPVEQPIVERKIEQAAAQPAPTQAELTAEVYFVRGFVTQMSGDLDTALADYEAALQLNPQYVPALTCRGTIRADKG